MCREPLAQEPHEFAEPLCEWFMCREPLAEAPREDDERIREQSRPPGAFQLLPAKRRDTPNEENWTLSQQAQQPPRVRPLESTREDPLRSRSAKRTKDKDNTSEHLE
jgi:hypothetical protein